MKRILKNLQKWQYNFTVFVILAKKIRQFSPRDILLTPQRFCFINQNKHSFKGLHLDSTTPYVRLFSAEYNDEAGKIAETNVLIEPQNTTKVQDTTALLAGHLEKNWTTGGVFQCLGYLIDPIELMF